MSGHLKDEDLLDLAEGRAGEAEAAHVAGCAACRGRVEDARAALRLAGEADVPEPSPLYWESFRRQVGRRIEEDRPGARRFVLPALVALAAALFVAIGVVGRGPDPAAPAAPALPAWSPLPAPEDDVAAELIRGLVTPDVDPDALLPCRGLQCYDALSEEESRAAIAALRAELGGRTL